MASPEDEQSGCGLSAVVSAWSPRDVYSQSSHRRRSSLRYSKTRKPDDWALCLWSPGTFVSTHAVDQTRRRMWWISEKENPPEGGQFHGERKNRAYSYRWRSTRRRGKSPWGVGNRFYICCIAVVSLARFFYVLAAITHVYRNLGTTSCVKDVAEGRKLIQDLSADGMRAGSWDTYLWDLWISLLTQRHT